jgi:hypothetical protein
MFFLHNIFPQHYKKKCVVFFLLCKNMISSKFFVNLFLMSWPVKSPFFFYVKIFINVLHELIFIVVAGQKSFD